MMESALTPLFCIAAAAVVRHVSPMTLPPTNQLSFLPDIHRPSRPTILISERRRLKEIG